MLRALIRAHLTLNVENCVDAAIELFIAVARDAIELRRQFRGQLLADSYATTSLWPATVELVGWLKSGTFQHTSPNLWTQFTTRDKDLKSNKRSLHWNLAHLALHCPGNADPQPAMNILHSMFDGRSIDEVRSELPSQVIERTAIWYFLKDLAGVLWFSEGQHADADWIETMESQLFTVDEAKRYAKKRSGITLGTNTRRVKRR